MNQARTCGKAEFVSPYVERLSCWLQRGRMVVHAGFFVRRSLMKTIAKGLPAEGEAIIATGKEGVLQFRWLAKNGDVVWVEAHWRRSATRPAKQLACAASR